MNNVLDVEAIAAQRELIQTLDIAKGLVIVIITLDHVSDYFHSGAFSYDHTGIAKQLSLFFSPDELLNFGRLRFAFLRAFQSSWQNKETQVQRKFKMK